MAAPQHTRHSTAQHRALLPGRKVVPASWPFVHLCLQVLYQDEALVQLLVACQAHNYLEFKLVEGR